MGGPFVGGQKFFAAQFASVPLLASVNYGLMVRLLHARGESLVAKAALEVFGPSVRDSLVRLQLVETREPSAAKLADVSQILFGDVSHVVIEEELASGAPLAIGPRFPTDVFPAFWKGAEYSALIILLVVRVDVVHVVHIVVLDLWAKTAEVCFSVWIL